MAISLIGLAIIGGLLFAAVIFVIILRGGKGDD
jgi:hypothetical protein